MSTNTETPIRETDIDVWAKKSILDSAEEKLVPKTGSNYQHGRDPRTEVPEGTISMLTYQELKAERVQKSQNRFMSHRNFIYQRIDIALILANCYQIRIILTDGHKNEFYHVLLGFALTSICSQVLFALIMVISWQADKTSINDKGGIKRANSVIGKVCQFLAILLVMITIISNIVVVEFGAMTDHDKAVYTAMNITRTN